MSKRNQAHKSIDILDYCEPEYTAEAMWSLVNTELLQAVAMDGWTPYAVSLCETRNNIIDLVGREADIVFYRKLSARQRFFIRTHGGRNAWWRYSTYRLKDFGKNLTLDEAKTPFARNILISEKMRAHYAF